MVNVWTFVPFLSGFLVTIIFFLIAFDYFGIEVNQELALGIVLIGLINGGFVSLWRLGKIHQGHFGMVIGFIFIIVAIIILYGVFSFAYTDDNGEIQMKQKLWDLTPQQSGVFVLIGVLGVFSLVTGIKLALQNAYFWGMGRG